MPIVTWDEKFALGVAEFDEHHRHLVALLNKVYDDFVDGTARQSLLNVLDELVDYATYHFAAEEHWMRIHKYAKLEEHRDEHDYFVARVTTYQKDFAAGRRCLTLEILSFLKDWLLSHILDSDAEYGRFAVQKMGG